MAVFSINKCSPDTQLPAARHLLGGRGEDVVSDTMGHRCHPACPQGTDQAPCCWAANHAMGHSALLAPGEQKRANIDPNPHSDPQVYKVSKGTRVKRVPQVQKDREDFQDTWG